jgi:CheY-like chemotaxis protein
VQGTLAGEKMIIVAAGLPDSTIVLIRSKLQPVAVEFQTPRSPEDYLSILNSRNITVGCVLIDSDELEDKGQSVCSVVRSINGSVPVIVLSSEQDKGYYMNAIRWGVTGFVIKPFRGDTLRSKLLECYRAQGEKSVEMITFDLEKYLRGEFRKAEKGGFSLSFMYATVWLDDPEEKGNAMSRAYYLNLFYETIKELFWDTDAFIRYNSKYYLGVFPFCGKDNIATLEGKMMSAFSELYSSRGLPAYVKLVTAFSSYPDDGERFLDVQKVLSDRVRMKMNDMSIVYLENNTEQPGLF